MGKTAVFVLATLQQIEPGDHVTCLVLCHARELAFQISHDFDRLGKYLPAVRTAVFFGGVPIYKDKVTLAEHRPHIVIGTPGRILQLARKRLLDLNFLKFFILDECDKMLETLGNV